MIILTVCHILAPNISFASFTNKMKDLFCRLIKKSKYYSDRQVLSGWKIDGYFEQIIHVLNSSNKEDDYYYTTEIIFEKDLDEQLINSIDKINKTWISN